MGGHPGTPVRDPPVTGREAVGKVRGQLSGLSSRPDVLVGRLGLEGFLSVSGLCSCTTVVPTPCLPRLPGTHHGSFCARFSMTPSAHQLHGLKSFHVTPSAHVCPSCLPLGWLPPLGCGAVTLLCPLRSFSSSPPAISWGCCVQPEHTSPGRPGEFDSTDSGCGGRGQGLTGEHIRTGLYCFMYCLLAAWVVSLRWAGPCPMPLLCLSLPGKYRAASQPIWACVRERGPEYRCSHPKHAELVASLGCPRERRTRRRPTTAHSHGICLLASRSWTT